MKRTPKVTPKDVTPRVTPREVEPPPDINNELPDVTEKREAEQKLAAIECAQVGHVFYQARDFCGRCFAPKPQGWTL